MRTPVARRLVASLIVVAAVVAAAQMPAVAGAGSQAQPPRKDPRLKLTEPWPGAEQVARRKAASDALPLFGVDAPLAVTLVTNFRVVNKDRDQKSTLRHRGEIRIAGADGKTETIAVTLRARGHVRRMARTCDSVPLRVEFPSAKGTTGTVFAGHTALKLVVPCNNGGEYEQYILAEHLAYRIFNVLTPESFRSRLASVTYVDEVTGKSSGPHNAIFLEDASDVARRLEGRVVELPRVRFSDVDPDTLETMMVFEYMIGNTDFSLYALHNVTFVQTSNRLLHPIAYDFDMAGLVHPPYAIPDRQLPIKSVRERLYRGPCRPIEHVQRILANFTAKKDAILALPGQIPGIDKRVREEARAFINEFYSATKNVKDARRIFVEHCSAASTM